MARACGYRLLRLIVVCVLVVALITLVIQPSRWTTPQQVVVEEDILFCQTDKK